MIATDLVRFAVHAVLAGLILAGTVRIWELVVLEALFGSAEAFFRPAAFGLLPQTVPEAEIQQAKAVTSMFDNLAEFLGPAVGTALVLGIGAGTAFALDAASFLFSAACLTRVHPRPRRAAAADRRRRRRARARSGPTSAPASTRSARGRGSGPRSPPSASPCSPVSPRGSCSVRSSPASSTATSPSSGSSPRPWARAP